MSHHSPLTIPGHNNLRAGALTRHRIQQLRANHAARKSQAIIPVNTGIILYPLYTPLPRRRRSQPARQRRPHRLAKRRRLRRADRVDKRVRGACSALFNSRCTYSIEGWGGAFVDSEGGTFGLQLWLLLEELGLDGGVVGDYAAVAGVGAAGGCCGGVVCLTGGAREGGDGAGLQLAGLSCLEVGNGAG